MNLKTVNTFIFQANMKEAEFQLVGSNSYAARFGETITDLGDIDDDGFAGECYAYFFAKI